MNYENDKDYETDKERDVTEIDAEGTQECSPSDSENEPEAVPVKRKKRKKKHYTLKFLGLVVLCVALYFFMHSAVFTVENIVMTENNHIGLKQVQKVTGIKTGMNLYDVKKGACEDKLLEDPYIKEVKIKRKLPDTVEINLVLRQPAAVIKNDKQFVLIDYEGTVLKITDKAPQFTVITGITVTEAEKGSTVSVKETEQYEKYMELLRKIKSSDMYFKRIEIDGKIVKLYIRDKFYCTGEMNNINAGLDDGNIKAVLWDLIKKKTTKGVVTVGDDNYYSYSK